MQNIQNPHILRFKHLWAEQRGQAKQLRKYREEMDDPGQEDEDGCISFVIVSPRGYPAMINRFIRGTRKWSTAALNYIFEQPEGTIWEEGQYGILEPLSYVVATGFRDISIEGNRALYHHLSFSTDCPLPLSLVRCLHYEPDFFSSQEQGRAYEVLAGAVACMTKNEYFQGADGSLSDDLPTDILLSLHRLTTFSPLVKECEMGRYGFVLQRDMDVVLPPQIVQVSSRTQQHIEDILCGDDDESNDYKDGKVSVMLGGEGSEVSTLNDATSMWCEQFAKSTIQRMARESYNKGGHLTSSIDGLSEEIRDDSVTRTFELKERIEEAMSHCSAEERFAFEWLAQNRDSETKSISEIARLIVKSESATKKMLYRARMRLRKKCLP